MCPCQWILSVVGVQLWICRTSVNAILCVSLADVDDCTLTFTKHLNTQCSDSMQPPLHMSSWNQDAFSCLKQIHEFFRSRYILKLESILSVFHLPGFNDYQLVSQIWCRQIAMGETWQALSCVTLCNDLCCAWLVCGLVLFLDLCVYTVCCIFCISFKRLSQLVNVCLC